MDNIPRYEDLKVTTMTVIMSLVGIVNTTAAFLLLPITKVVIPQTRELSKCKLPHCKTPGAILSLRYRGNIRGVIRNKLGPFKNAVTIDISTTKKNINLKLSTSSIHICGAPSREISTEAANHVISHLTKLQYIIEKVQNNLEVSKEIVEWIKEHIKGEATIKPIWVETNYSNVTLSVYEPVDDYTIKSKIDATPPKYFDRDILNLFISFHEDFIYYKDFCSKLDFLLTIKYVIARVPNDAPCSPILRLDYIDEAMVNYNYSLGFEVDRSLLDYHIDGLNGFMSRYNNALSTSVVIELPYKPREGTIIKRRKNKIPHHTFLVYKSGSVTQSGPGGDMMRDVYYLFMNTIMMLKDQIIYRP